MAHDPLFDSAWLKWAWAVRHGHFFEADIAAFGSDPDRPPVVTCRTEYQPKRHAIVVFIESCPAIPSSWGLRLGDVAFAYRCAIDHIAWAVVTRGKTPPARLRSEERGGIHFPIADNNRAFNGLVSPKSGSSKKHSPAGNLPGARRADIAIIRRYQPYNRGESRAPFQILSMVQGLNNRDKHQTIQPIFPFPTQAGLVYGTPIDCVITDSPVRRARRNALKVGAEVAAIRVRKSTPKSKPKLEVQCEFAAQVCLDNRVTVVDWMDNLRTWIGSLLLEFSEPPAEVHRIVPEQMTE